MATALGPQTADVASAPTLHIMDQTTADPQPDCLPGGQFDSGDALAADDPSQQLPRNMPPSPLPPFVFPARPAPPTTSTSRARGRRPKSAIETQGLTVGQDDTSNNNSDSDNPARSAPLPNFTFNPGGVDAAETSGELLSPTASSTSPRSPQHSHSPSKSINHGHRRGGSEFVGGNIRKGDSITIMNNSPTKSEGDSLEPPPPSFQPPQLGEPPSAGARRHRHRRSAALSSHDLTLILQPPKPPGAVRGSSAPTSPAGFGLQGSMDAMPKAQSAGLPTFPRTPEPAPEQNQDVNTEFASPDRTPQAFNHGTPRSRATRPVPRARVGFSDTLEFIPRPLSLVSSDASSTATARPGGHSVSGSISSIISLTEDSSDKPDRSKEPGNQAPLDAGLSPQTSESRPSTAGAVLERSESIQSTRTLRGSPRRRNSIPTLTAFQEPTDEVPPAQPSPTKTPKRWSFFGLDPFTVSESHASHAHPRPSSTASSDSLSKAADASSTTSDHVSDSALDASDSAPNEQVTKKKSKKKKKVKAWAGSILKSKSRPRGSKKTKGTAPAEPAAAETEPPMPEHVEELQQPISTPVEEMPSPITPTLTVTDSTGASLPAQTWQSRPAAPEDDSSMAMIDLDAALGPFNTPLPHNPEWDAAQKATTGTSTPMKRQLHSAQGMRGFSGPGMHYHRRAESAPEMVPFEAGRFGIPRFGSTSTMADVFEEDEEDGEDEDAKTNLSSAPSKESTKEGQAASDPGSDDETPPATDVSATAASLDSQSSRDSEFDRRPHAASMKSERSMNSLQEQVIVEEPRAVNFRTSTLFQSPEDSPGSSTPSPRHLMTTRDLPPVDVSPLHLPTSATVPISPYSMSHGSYPSPRSPMSYDAHRISTAPSSVHEETTLQSLLLGEPGPEVRLSMDVPPSLTSSTSTMTRDSTFHPQVQPRPRKANRPEERPASVSSMAFGRRRSSLASLSRLISSSHGERSKLSTEVRLDNDTEEKKAKASRARRLSRMMQFWKSKEGSSA